MGGSKTTKKFAFQILWSVPKSTSRSCLYAVLLKVQIPDRGVRSRVQHLDPRRSRVRSRKDILRSLVRDIVRLRDGHGPLHGIL